MTYGKKEVEVKLKCYVEEAVHNNNKAIMIQKPKLVLNTIIWTFLWQINW